MVVDIGPSARLAAQTSDALDEALEEGLDVDVHGDVEIRLATPGMPPVGDGLAGRPAALELDLDGHRRHSRQAGIERRREGQGIVDEGPVEPIGTAVELEVEAQRGCDELDDRVARSACHERPAARGAQASAWRAR